MNREMIDINLEIRVVYLQINYANLEIKAIYKPRYE